MWGCWSFAATRISRLKRSTFTPAVSSGGRTLTTTLRRGGRLPATNPPRLHLAPPLAAQRPPPRHDPPRHPAAAELTLEGVGVTEGPLQLVAEVHLSLSLCGEKAGRRCSKVGNRRTGCQRGHPTSPSGTDPR